MGNTENTFAPSNYLACYDSSFKSLPMTYHPASAETHDFCRRALTWIDGSREASREDDRWGRCGASSSTSRPLFLAYLPSSWSPSSYAWAEGGPLLLLATTRRTGGLYPSPWSDLGTTKTSTGSQVRPCGTESPETTTWTMVSEHCTHNIGRLAITFLYSLCIIVRPLRMKAQALIRCWTGDQDAENNDQAWDTTDLLRQFGDAAGYADSTTAKATALTTKTTRLGCWVSTRIT